MVSARSQRRGLGGLGALFFLGSLGAIAVYVQQQTVPEERDLARKAATMLPIVAAEEEKPPSLPWEDRLDLASASLVPIVAADPPADAQTTPNVPTADPTTTKAPVDPANARYVQDLNDGHRILLTLDPVLQDAALQIFRNREVPYAGAVMVDLEDNAVLVLAGHSTMDPSVDPLEIVATPWAPAASTFKLVTAAALLEDGRVNPGTKACFSGGLHGIEDEELQDVPSRDTRCETLSSAIAHSYNLVIGKLALQHLDQQTLADMARSFQFESDIPFEFRIERSPAHIPSEATERAKVAAGFWNVDLSPVHAALIASIFAREGIYQPPHVIDQVIGPDGSDMSPARPKPRRVLARDTAAAVAEMMKGTTTEGTARVSFRDKQGNPYVRGIEVAGKTGSLTGKRPPALNYNWFIGFAPADRPRIAFAVLLANEPAWRIKAHYAARRLVQIWLERRDAIARQRDVRLTITGLELPHRDPSGVLVKTAPPTPANDPASLPPPPPPENTSEPALPPVPGPLPPPPQNG